MAISDGTVALTFDAQRSALGHDGSTMALLDAAVAGGSAVTAFLAPEVAAVARLQATIATGGDSVWIDGHDATTGDPTWTVVDGESSLTVLATLDDQQDDGLVVFVTVVVEVGVDDERRIVQLSAATGTWAGGPAPDLALGTARQKFLEAVGKVAKNFVKAFLQSLEQVDQGVGADAALAAGSSSAADAAEAAGEDGVEIALSDTTTITMDVSISVFDVANVVVSLGLLALKLVLVLLSKRLVLRLRVYNRSSSDFEVALWVNDSRSTVPFGLQLGAPVSLVRPAPTWTPARVIGVDPTSFLEVLLVNADGLTGVDGILTGRADASGFTLGAHVPTSGGNTIAATPDVTEDQASWLGEHGRAVTTTSASGTGLVVTVGTNRLRGRSPDLATGALGYNFDVVAVVADATG